VVEASSRGSHGRGHSVAAAPHHQLNGESVGARVRASLDASFACVGSAAILVTGVAGVTSAAGTLTGGVATGAEGTPV